jgi:hypothetical protein|tara:strand:+ start:1179 stop:1457 length:279 start_codon:yes stop_codon:yes gene_type:complete
MTIKNPTDPRRLPLGPLNEVEKRIEDFVYNLYFSYVFDETVKSHQQLQDDYIEAFLDQDDEKMRAINRELVVVESAFEVTANMIDTVEEGYS